MATRTSKTAVENKAATNGEHKITSRIVTVTPAKAAEMLEHNTHNRKINSRDVDKWAIEMTEGRWELDGDAIRFDAEGALLNGQHRLSAVVKSGTTQKFLVLSGLPTETQINMDTGRRRTAGNALELSGFSGYSAALAATARIGVRVARSGLNAERFIGITASNQEIVDFVNAHPELYDAVKYMTAIYRNADIPSVGVGAYAYWRMQLLDPEAALAFWTSASDKVGLKFGDPVLAMTRRFAQARRQREKISHQNQLSMIFRAWNAYRTNAVMQRLPVRGSYDDIAVPEPI
jgi:hypothetical protein